jgi:hypothetical protein
VYTRGAGGAVPNEFGPDTIFEFTETDLEPRPSERRSVFHACMSNLDSISRPCQVTSADLVKCVRVWVGATCSDDERLNTTMVD